MPKQKLPKAEKRTKNVEVSYNEPEYQTIRERAEAAGKPIARFIREMSLDKEKIYVVARRDEIAAARARKMSELVNQLYYIRQSISAKKNPPLPQTDSYEMNEREVEYWNEMFVQVRALNAELRGYTDI